MLHFQIWGPGPCRSTMNLRADIKVNLYSLQLLPSNPHFTIEDNVHKIVIKIALGKGFLIKNKCTVST